MERIDSENERRIIAVLRAHHQATATKDIALLKSVFAGWGQFVGTDDTEQWSYEEYIDRLVKTESGWRLVGCGEPSIYSTLPRIRVEHAMFFEVVDHEKYGLMRGSGVVVKSSDAWMIVQYVLSFSVPNHVVDNTNLLEILAT